MATISRERTSKVTSSTARVPSGNTFDTCSKPRAGPPGCPGLRFWLSSSSVEGTAGRPSTPKGYMAAGARCVVKTAQAPSIASDEERLHLQALDHGLNLGVGRAAVEPFGGVEEPRQHVHVAGGNHEDAWLAEGPVHRCVDVRLLL